MQHRSRSCRGTPARVPEVVLQQLQFRNTGLGFLPGPFKIAWDSPGTLPTTLAGLAVLTQNLRGNLWIICWEGIVGKSSLGVSEFLELGRDVASSVATARAGLRRARRRLERGVGKLRQGPRRQATHLMGPGRVGGVQVSEWDRGGCGGWGVEGGEGGGMFF